MPPIRTCIVVVTLAVLSFGDAFGQERLMGSWAGTLEVGGTELRIVFHVKQDDGGLSATMDSPDQGATGIPVSSVTVEGDSVTLAVARINGRYEGALSSDGSTMEGSWTQGGQSAPLVLTPANEDGAAPPPRPQHPEPPYPYVTEDVTFVNEDAHITLAGTLTRPKGDGPHPAVVLVSGSGPQNRDSEVFNHKLFHVLADHLTRQGLAVLRYDERGVGDSEGTFDGATMQDFAGDVAAAVRFLKEQPSTDQNEVGLLGMSEGGLVAPLVHTKHQPAAFLVLMAGPSVPGGEILVEQRASLVAAQGASPAAVDSIRRLQRRLMEAVRTGTDSAAIAQSVRPLLKDQGNNDEQIDAQIEQMTTDWFRAFVRHDPAPVLRALDVPVFALYGRLDLQVPPEQNVDPMRAALSASPSEDTTVRVLNGLNHLFQPAETGLPTEYGQIDTTMAPAALNAVTEWIRERTRPDQHP